MDSPLSNYFKEKCYPKVVQIGTCTLGETPFFDCHLILTKIQFNSNMAMLLIDSIYQNRLKYML